MNSTKVNHVLEEIASWNAEEKGFLLEKLLEKNFNIGESKDTSHNPKEKLDLLYKLCGAWADDTSEDLAKEILESRTISDKNFPLD